MPGDLVKYPKVGRTQLQDAVPMTVGQEFTAWSETLAEARIQDARGLLQEINDTSTAADTGSPFSVRRDGYRQRNHRRPRLP